MSNLLKLLWFLSSKWLLDTIEIPVSLLFHSLSLNFEGKHPIKSQLNKSIILLYIRLSSFLSASVAVFGLAEISICILK